MGNKDGSMGSSVKSTPLAAVRSPPTTKIRRTLKGHFGKITALHWSGNSRDCVSASQDGNLLVWNAVTSNKLQSISLKSSYVMSVGIEQSKGNMVACGGLDNLCTVYKLDAPEVAMEMASHDGFLACIRFLSEEHLLTSSGDSTILRWDIEGGRVLDTFAEHAQDAMFICLRPGDPNVFVSGSVDTTAKIWDIRSPQQSVQTFGGHSSDINSVDFMPECNTSFASCSEDGTCRVFDMRCYNEVNRFGEEKIKPVANPNEDGEAIPEADDEPVEMMTSIGFSRSGRLLFAGHSDSSLMAFDVLSDKTTPAFTISQAHDGHVSCVGVSPNGDALCTGSWDTNLKVSHTELRYDTLEDQRSWVIQPLNSNDNCSPCPCLHFFYLFKFVGLGLNHCFRAST